MQVKIRIIILLVLLSSSRGWGQLFQNRNLYDIWITADQYVDAGKFEEAIKLYEAAPQVPEFARQLKITRRLQSVFRDGERLYRSRKYAEALETFSKYREIAPELHAAILDERIQACLQQLDKVVVKKLAESTRIVAGFEYAHKGDRKLMELDTLAALYHYTKARQLGAGLNQTLRDHYQEGLLAVKALRNWGDEYRRALASDDAATTLRVLKTYRSASKFIISALEYEIKSAEARENTPLVSSSGENPQDQMRQYARECRIEELVYFVRNERTNIAQAGKILSRLAEYQQIERDIRQHSKGSDNGDFLESAYRNLINKAGQVPILGEYVRTCAQKFYFDYLYGRAQLSERKGFENKDKREYETALRYIMEAYQLGLTQYNASLEALQSRVAAQMDCEDRQRDFVQQLPAIRLHLTACRVGPAKLAWDSAAVRLAGCGLDNSSFAAQYIALRDSVNQSYEADSLLADLKTQGDQALGARQCENARQLMEQISRLSLCNSTIRDSLLVKYQRRVRQCEQYVCYTTARGKAFQSAESREWKKSYDYYEQAYTCASEEQKLRIKEIMAAMECDAYPERCRGSNVSISLEPSIRVGANKPKYIEEGVARETSYGYLAAAGLQLSFLSYLNPIDVVLGIDYFQTEYQLLQKGHSAGDFKISGAEFSAAFKLHAPKTDPNRIRPYLKGGFEIILPMKYALENHYKNESTNDRSLLKKQSLGALAGLGIELQKKKFGFFVEVVAGYNFSGIYNANAVSSSGARGITEAHFRTAGLRLGARLW